MNITFSATSAVSAVNEKFELCHFSKKSIISDFWLDFIPQYDIDYIVLKEVW